PDLHSFGFIEGGWQTRGSSLRRGSTIALPSQGLAAQCLRMLQISLHGAPRPMKMGTIVSLWRYDVATEKALPSADLRRLAIQSDALWRARAISPAAEVRRSLCSR